MTTAVVLCFAGSSFSIYSSASYNKYIRDWLEPQHTGTYTTLAVNGANTWRNLVNLSTYLSASLQTIIIDTANDDNNTLDRACIEAFIRRVWTYNPMIRIIGVSAPSWNAQDTSNDAIVSTPTNLTAVNNAKTVFEYYDTSYAAYLDKCIELVPSTYHLNQLTDDTVHPNALGYSIMAGLVEAFLPFSGKQLSGSLPDYHLADAADLEETPIKQTGVEYTSRTGTWADNGTSTSSSEADATITYSGTFRSFGCYRADAIYPAVSISIDGGVYATRSFDHGGYDVGARAAHTITIKVVTTCKIDEFWAI